MYSITTDTGTYNTGLNLNLCGMLAVLGGPDVMTSAVRTVSLRFNTYNGQCDGLFSSVDITAKFTLGEQRTRQTDSGRGICFCPTLSSSSKLCSFICFISSLDPFLSFGAA